MKQKNNKKIINEKNNLPDNPAGQLENKRKRGRPKKTENNIFIELKNNKKINNSVQDLDKEKTDIVVLPDTAIKKRGRPKGKKDITQRKTRKDGIQSSSYDEVRTKILRFNMALYNLPKIQDYNDTEIMQERTNLFFNLCIQYNVSPTLAGYSFSLGVDRNTLYNWLNGKTERIKNRECFGLLKNAYDFINNSYEQLLTEGKIIPVSAFFLLQNNYGYKQQTDHVITAKQENQDNEQDIIDRANLLTD